MRKFISMPKFVSIILQNEENLISLWKNTITPLSNKTLDFPKSETRQFDKTGATLKNLEKFRA